LIFEGQGHYGVSRGGTKVAELGVSLFPLLLGDQVAQ
jgi:hypothetical protein